MAKRGKQDEEGTTTAGVDPWGGLFENPQDWFRCALSGNPPLRLAENWVETNRWLAEAIYYDAAYDLLEEGRRWEDCPAQVQSEYMTKHLRRRVGGMLHDAVMAHFDVIVQAARQAEAAAEADVVAAGLTKDTAPDLYEEHVRHHAHATREEWDRERAARAGGRD